MLDKFKRFIYIFVMLIFLFPAIVFAEDNLVLNVDKTDLNIGDEIVVSAVAPEDLNTYALLATLKYDNNVFQAIDEKDFTISDTKIIAYNEDNNKFGIINTTGSVTEESVLFSVRLKVKENANVGDTNIALTNITSSDGNGKVNYPASQIKVSISSDDKEEADQTNQENTIIEDKENILKVFSNKPIVIGLGIGSGLLLVCLIHVISTKRGKKTIILTGISLAIFVGLFSALLILNDSKKDVNNDGQKDYNDAKEILEYLIDLEGTKEDGQNSEQDNDSNNNSTNNSTDNKDKNNNSSNNKNPSKKPDDKFDTNNDGKVDVEDIGDIVEEASKKSSAKLSSVESGIQYGTKGEDIVLAFKAEITPKGTYIKKVKIGDKYYEVTRKGDTYYVNVGTKNEAGGGNL